jgi:hypothetical protein
MTKGLYRTISSDGTPAARVLYDNREMDVPEERYRLSGYQPGFEDLPLNATALEDRVDKIMDEAPDIADALLNTSDPASALNSLLIILC